MSAEKTIMTGGKIIPIGGFPVLSIHRRALAANLLEIIRKNNKAVLLFANTNFIVKCRLLLEKEIPAQLILVNDGIGLDIAAKLFQGEKFQDNLNGTDFTPFLFSHAAQPLRVFMLGGQPDVLEKAARHVERQLGQEVVGICDGYQGADMMAGLVARINASQPDVVLVAMGNPMQEAWIIQNCDVINAKLFMGVGALFDFWSGNKSRAPGLIRRLRLEWFYRLCLEPRRLLRRYTLDIVVFLMNCLKYK